MVDVVIAIGIMALLGVGAVISMYWDECTDWVYEQIEKSHQIKRKWKTKSFSTIVYNWECECGKQEWSSSKTMAYNHFVTHRKRERKESRMDKKVTETEGW